jgi:hypothetical protein
LQQIGGAVMTSGTLQSGSPSITVRPSSEEKRLFAALAAKRGMSESKLALIAVRALLRDNCPVGLPLDTPSTARDPGTDRITIRLRLGDLRAIATRAVARRTKPSTYIAALVRGHIARNPPLVMAEMEAFRKAIVVLAGCGTLAARSLRNVPRDSADLAELSQQLVAVRAAVASLEERMHDVVYESLQSWESNYG